MKQNNRRMIAEELLAIFPLINKKLFPPVHTLPDSNLNITHFFILKTLERDGAIPTTEIGKKLSILKSNLSPLVNKLKSMEYVTTCTDEKDRRIKYIQLTAKGKAFLDERKQMLQDEIQLRLAPLDDNDLETLSQSVQQLGFIISKLES
ncbi:MarR family winged helix-turn-helix transcriptional regulator [Alteribacillus sp. HJP-4]|uniref:MarR family winged helix-turn-helix transcriptional regulator n=1 Tax=Alteribacillus sp. HJP-4 TaxID=2775394 RepID=UPI0035CCECFD